MQHKGTLTLETKRLVLRRFVLKDCECAFRNWTNDARVTKFLRWKPHQDVNVTKAVFNTWIANYQYTNVYQWAIVVKDGDEVIGSIGVVDQDATKNMMHIGYCIGHAWWNKGFVSEALNRVITFLFEEVQVNRIESQHDPMNKASGRVMMKCNMIYETTLYASDFNNQGIVDAMLYRILKEEYEEAK